MKGLDQSKDIDPWLKRFRELDADGSGALDEDVSPLYFRRATLSNAVVYCAVVQ